MQTGGSTTRSTGQRNQLLASVRETFEHGLELIERKNRDYGADEDTFRNFRSVEILNLSVEKAILVRVLDKISRLDNLLDKNPAVSDESFGDTATDLINYIAILKAYREITHPASE